MKKMNVGGVAYDAAVGALVPRMERVGEHRESLQRLQDVWDQLTLLGQISGIANDITGTAAEFNALTSTLLNALAGRLLDNRLHSMHAQAQVAIDVLVRNLFERTADIGFLATDRPIEQFFRTLAEGDEAAIELRRSQLRSRFEAYVAKYSVYDDVVVLGPDGQVLVRLDTSVKAERSSHPLLQAAARPNTPFVESFGEMDFLGGRRGLVYSAAIRSARGHELLGVLCLSFRFDDEMRGIFLHMPKTGPCDVAVLQDDVGRVIASSDPWQIPENALLPRPDAGHRVFFAGTEYLAVRVSASGYQGYPGPGWTACALVPMDQAFRAHIASTEQAEGVADNVPRVELKNSTLFTPELGHILDQASSIQRGLERSVWNGEIRGRQRTEAAADAGFGGALLQQITATGARIKFVMEDAISDLQASATASILNEVKSCASLAIDIMDRNLYERANDCRWWALDGVIQRSLKPGAEDLSGSEAGRVLAHINSLYTVYSSLLLLDASGTVCAASNADGEQWLGQSIQADWVKPALQLHDGQAFVRSRFEATALYADRMTFVYAAAVRTPAQGEVRGAVAIVFDGQPQFEAMLRDTLPRGADGQPMPEATGLFVSRKGMVVSSTDTQAHPIGSASGLEAELAGLGRGESRHWMVNLKGTVYAAGASMSPGYREYNSSTSLQDEDVACVVLVRLGPPPVAVAALPGHSGPLQAKPQRAGEGILHLACFHSGGEWLAIDACAVVEAIDVERLTGLPSRPEHLAGLVMYGGLALPVVDLKVLRKKQPAAERSDAALVIVCRDAAGKPCFGLQVDELHRVLQVPAADIRPMEGYLAQHDPHARGVISLGSPAQPASGMQAAPMLTVLSHESLLRGVR